MFTLAVPIDKVSKTLQEHYDYDYDRFKIDAL